MKREALRHPKMLDLASRLGIDRARAVGILTLLWDFTADAAAPGHVGKWPDGAIARACEWGTSPGDASHDATAFVQALADSGWIDPHPAARYLIHDWPQHCERWVKSKLNTLGEDFHPAYSEAKPTPSPDASRDTAPDATGDPPRASAGACAPDLPYPTLPIQECGLAATSAEGSDSEETNGKPRRIRYPEAFEAFWQEYPPRRDGIKPNKEPALQKWKRHVQPEDRERVVEAARRYARSPSVKEGVVMHAATFLPDWRAHLKSEFDSLTNAAFTGLRVLHTWWENHAPAHLRDAEGRLLTIAAAYQAIAADKDNPKEEFMRLITAKDPWKQIQPGRREEAEDAIVNKLAKLNGRVSHATA